MKQQSKPLRTDPRQDWLCYSCHNLNYSFRKVCNRCGVTTRKDSQVNYDQMQYYLMYYHGACIGNSEQEIAVHANMERIAESQSFSQGRYTEKAHVRTNNSKNMDNLGRVGKEAFQGGQHCLQMLFHKNWTTIDYNNEAGLSKSEGRSQQTGEEWSQDDEEQLRSVFDLSFL